MTRRLAILAFIALAGVASAQYSDVRIHASRPTEQGPEVWLAESLPESLYTNCVLWLPFPKAYTSTQYSFAVARATNDVTISGATWTNESSGAMYFDGNDDAIFSSEKFFNINKWTGWSCCFWIKLKAEIGASQKNIAGWGEGSGKEVFQLFFLTNSFGFWVRDPASVVVDTRVQCDYFDNAYTFVALTHNAATQERSIYTNGILAKVISSSTQTSVVTSARNSVIGGFNDRGSIVNNLNFDLFDILIFTNYCVTSNEQFNYYNQTRSRYGL